MAKIFISYKRIDKVRVFEIRHLIESHIGEECWIDIEGIESDAQFKDVIIRAINNCEVVLFMYSKAHTEIRDFEKDWTVRELNFASTKNKRIVFVNIDGTPLTDEFSFDYGLKQQVDARSSEALNRLIRDLQNWLNIPVKEPVKPKKPTPPEEPKEDLKKDPEEDTRQIEALNCLIRDLRNKTSIPVREAVKPNKPTPSEDPQELFNKGNRYYSAGDYENALKYFRKAVKQEHADAQFYLGVMYEYGQSVVQNYTKAITWYRKAAQQGHASAQFKLALYYERKDYSQAKKWLELAANQGFQSAKELLKKRPFISSDKYNDNFLKKFVSKAFSPGKIYITILCLLFIAGAIGLTIYIIDQANPKELFDKGYNYELSGDYSNAVTYYRKAAEQGNASAQNNLGKMYYNGQGVSQNYIEAVTWYRKAAEQGNASAQNNLGVMYYQGQGVARNYTEAVTWYRKAAEQGLADAQTWLGWMYEHGYGVEQDYTEALKWYRKAAEQGNASAQNNLGKMYYNGQGVSQNYIEAVTWYRKAAEQGLSNAQYKLGICYYNGSGVPRNRTEAKKWLELAAEQGHEYAKDFLKKHFDNK